MGFALPAWAESDPCKGSRPVGKDAENLEAAALGAIGNRRVEDLEIKDVHRCHLGPERTSVRIESARSRNPDGVQEWWTVYCSRLKGRQQWDCAAERQRVIELRVTVAGAERKIELTPAADMTASAARELALRAIALLDDPSAAPPRCADYSVDDQKSWAGMRASLGTQIRMEPAGPQPGAIRIVLSEGFAIEYPSGCWSGWYPVSITQ